LACKDEFFVNNLLDVEENDEHALDSVPRLSRSRGIWPFHIRLTLSSLHICLIIATVSAPLLLRLAQNLMLLFCRIHREIASDSKLQIKGRKKSARSLSCVKFCAMAPKIC
jgi:hypothetical protein